MSLDPELATPPRALVIVGPLDRAMPWRRETDVEAGEAAATGYRVFRVAPDGSTPLAGYASFSVSAEQGRRLTCVECGSCNGGSPAAGPATPCRS